MSLRRKLFYAMTLAIVVVLLVLPTTGWLARLQLLSFLPNRLNRNMVQVIQGRKPVKDKLYRETAEQYPNDWQIQFAYAELAESSDEKIQRLEALNRRVPGKLSVIAALLRNKTNGKVRLNRAEEENLLNAPSKRTEKIPESKPNDPAEVEAFIALATEGERREPSNAYFPVMATIGYFAAHRDTEALEAWTRASNKTTWDDYTADEATAKWKLLRAMNGGDETGAVARMSSMADVLLPHLSSIRNVGRVVTAKAVQAELAGDVAQGLRLRQASRRNGERMAQGNYLITALVGRAIILLSGHRPGGVEAESNPFKGDGASERWAKERQERYKAYLASIGQAGEAQEFTAAVAKTDAIRTIWSEGNSKTYFGFGMKTYQYLGIWCANALLLTGALFSLVFAIIFKLVYRFSPNLQQGQPLQPCVKWGVCTGIVSTLSLIVFAVALQAEAINCETIFWSAVGIGLVLLLTPPVAMRLSLTQLLHGILVAVATIVALGGLIGAGTLAVSAFGPFLRSFGMLSTDAYGMYNSNQLVMVVAFGLVLLVPLSLLGLFGIFSKILRVPFAAGVTRGMRAMAVPLAAALLMIWSGTLVVTLRQEHAAITELERMANDGELQVIADLLHRPLPK